jgi:outer membrane lipase/esterase
MSKFQRGAALAVLAAAATLSAATAASAQSYGRLVVFGDSLSDNGNLFAVTGGAAPAAPFVGGRFSTGPVFVELLGFNLGRPTAGTPVTSSINYAYGGSRTDAIASPGPGMRTQLAAYTAAGGKFGPNDLVSILGGANNIFQALPTAGASANPTGAIAPVSLAAASDINFLTNSVAAAGAGTVLVTNLPKLSLTPQFRNTAAAPLADYAVTTFNGALLTGLQTTAAAQANTNIIYMDLFKIGDVIANNPGQFGVTNVTDQCALATPRCADPGYFYVDGVHPTALGHRLIAQLANDYLYYGDIGAQSAVLGETAFRHREDSLDASSEALSGRADWADGTAISISGSYDQTDTDARGVVGEASSKGYGLRMAVENAWSNTWKVGLAGSYRHADIEAGRLDADVNSYAFDVYAGWRSGAVFVNAGAGVAADQFDTRRLTSLAPITHVGKTDGVSKGARLQAGLWWDMGGVALSPRAAVTWASSEMDGFNEAGAAAEYAYQDRTVQATTAEISLRAEANMGGFGLFAEGGYRDALDDSSDAVRTGIAYNTAKILAREVDEPFGGQILASAGLRGDWGPVKVDVGYRGRFGDKADSHMGAVTLTLPL